MNIARQLNVYWLKPAATIVIIAVLVASVVLGMKSRLSEPYYRLVDSQTAYDFLWIRDNLSPQTKVSVLRTDVAAAYAALTRGNVYSIEAWPYTNLLGQRARQYLFLGTTPSDELWAYTNGVSIVYAPHWTDGGYYLDRLRPGVYTEAFLAP